MADNLKDKDLKPLSQPASQINQPSRVVTPTQPKGTGYTNIQNIVSASQGNKLGQTVVGGINKTGQQVNQNLNQANQQFQQGLTQNQLATDSNKQQASSLINMAGQGQTLNDDQIALAEKYRNGQYQGPTGLNQSDRLLSQAVDAEQLGQLGGSEAGRTGLLQRFVGAPQYNAGQQKLDSLILGQDQSAINQARAATRGLGSEAIRDVNNAQDQANFEQAKSTQFANQFKNDVNTANTGVDTAVQARATQVQAQEQAKANELNNFINYMQSTPQFRGSLTDNTLKSNWSDAVSGISDPTLKQHISDLISSADKAGLDPRQAISQLTYSGTPDSVNAGAVVNQDDLNKYAALSKLSGQDPTVTQLGQYQAGTYNTAAVDQAKTAADFLKNYQGSNASSDVAKQQFEQEKSIPGIFDKDLLQNIVSNPKASFYNNPNAMKAIMTPQEFAAYQNSAKVGDSALGATGLRQVVIDRAQRNLARMQGNQNDLTQAKSSFNGGQYDFSNLGEK